MSENDDTRKTQNDAPRITSDKGRVTSDEGVGERMCAHCAYARWMPPGPSVLLGDWFGRWVCTNHPDSGGDIREVLPRSVCANFRFRHRPAQWTEPPEPDRPGVKHIALTRNKYAIVDAADFAELNRWKWTAYYTCGQWYAGRNDHGKCVLMHRQIMKPPKGMVVDHKNRNGLDNTRANLRIVTYSQNNCNRRPRSKTSRYKGVSYDARRNQYRATACEDHKSLFIGRYDTEIEAARAADRKNYELNGEFAYLNFPEEIRKNRTTEPQSPQRQGSERGKGTRKKAEKATKREPIRRSRRKRGGQCRVGP